MTLSVVYSNFCGRVVSETRNGVESDYVCDPQGSTIGLLDASGTMTDSWEYWPYGEVINHTGSSVTPLTFLGVIGYFQDVISKLSYVRARYLRVDLGRWLTVDPLWPQELAYRYADSMPTTKVDPTGLITGSYSFGHCSHMFYNIEITLGRQFYLPSLQIILRFCFCLDDLGIEIGGGAAVGTAMMALAVLLANYLTAGVILILNIVGGVLAIIFALLAIWAFICYHLFPKQKNIGLGYVATSIGSLVIGTPTCTRCPPGE